MGEFVDETVADWVSSISNDPATQSMLEKVSTEIKAENQQFDDTLDKRLTSSLAAERNQYEQQVSELRTLLASVTAERDAARELRGDLVATATMFETYAPEIFPEVNEHGQKHFGRVMMESAAEAIRAAISESQKGVDEDA